MSVLGLTNDDGAARDGGRAVAATAGEYIDGARGTVRPAAE